jgi:homoserine dehydrogenase
LDVRNARELGYVIKLLAVARRVDGDTGALVVRVAPALVRRGTPLAEVRGPYNAIRVVGDAVGDTLLYGRGAGGMPTASAVVGDLLDVGLGRALSTARALDRRFAAAEAPRLAAPEEVRSRYYLRVSIADRPGMLGTIALVLGRHGVSIASVIQHDPGDDERPGAPVPLVFMTHVAREGDVRRAIGEINRLEGVTPPCVCLAVED